MARIEISTTGEPAMRAGSPITLHTGTITLEGQSAGTDCGFIKRQCRFKTCPVRHEVSGMKAGQFKNGDGPVKEGH